MLSSKPNPTTTTTRKAKPLKQQPPIPSPTTSTRASSSTSTGSTSSTSSSSDSSSHSNSSGSGGANKTSAAKQQHQTNRKLKVSQLLMKKNNLLSKSGIVGEDVTGSDSMAELLVKTRRCVVVVGQQNNGALKGGKTSSPPPPSAIEKCGDCTASQDSNDSGGTRLLVDLKGGEGASSGSTIDSFGSSEMESSGGDSVTGGGGGGGGGCVASTSSSSVERNRWTPSELKILGLKTFFEDSVARFHEHETSAAAAAAAAKRPPPPPPLQEQMDGKPKVSNKSGKKDEGGGSDGGEIIVCVRARPLLPDEISKNIYQSITTTTSSTMSDTTTTTQTTHLHSMDSKIDGTPKVNTKSFKVDYAFDETCGNEVVYEKTAGRLIDLVLGGGIGSLFAYGQTGSGKTYTMTAMQNLLAADLFKVASEYSPSLSGGAVAETTEAAPDDCAVPQQQRGHHPFEFRVCFFEIFGNQARDLLSIPSPNEIHILEDVFGKVQLKGITHHLIHTPQDFTNLINIASTQRKTEGTSKNDRSSRSHAVCQIRVKNTAIPEMEDGILNLLDLAGSESSADSRWHNRERVLESVGINKSLATLKECIRSRAVAAASSSSSSLNHNNNLRDKKRTEHIHIPYRSSKLTMLLKDAFELSSLRMCKTIVIAALNPSILDTAQSLNTLRYIAPLKVSVSEARGGSTQSSVVDPDDPAQWTNAQLQAYIIEIQSSNTGPFKAKIDPRMLCPFESGKQLFRITEGEFISRCCKSSGVSGRQAKEFYVQLWKLVVDARSRRRQI